jgi:hypothetical protein
MQGCWLVLNVRDTGRVEIGQVVIAVKVADNVLLVLQVELVVDARVVVEVFFLDPISASLPYLEPMLTEFASTK